MVKSFSEYICEEDIFYSKNPREIDIRLGMAINDWAADMEAEKFRKTLDEMPRVRLEHLPLPIETPLELNPRWGKPPYRG